MHFKNTSIADLYLIEPFHKEDVRGTFVKTFHAEEFAAQGLEYEFLESFYSASARDVIRGMHFQWPPHDHAKLVYCTHGEVLDVIVDLRSDSDSFRQYEAFTLNDQNKNLLYIPHGMAHGFCARTNGATLVYLTTSVHSQEHDTGIRYDSFGFKWPVTNPILSERDAGFIALDELDSPF